MNTPLIASEEIRKNFIKSFILVAVVIAAVLGASWLLGNMLGDVKTGLLIGVGIAVFLIPLQILTAKWVILSMAHGRNPDPENPRERRLLHLAEGLSISAGLQKVPDVYILQTPVANAFASGLNEQSAFIGVTQGLLDTMDDQQLEGVLAHEFGHIIHRDIMLNQLVVGLISVLLVIVAIIENLGFMELISGGRRRRDRDSGGGAVVLVLLLIVLLIRPLAAIFGALLQSSISRQREYAADAVAVRLCSYNEGLASALEKLAGDDHYSRQEVESLGSNQLAAMYIHFPAVNELFASHPPIKERIARLRNMY